MWTKYCFFLFVIVKPRKMINPWWSQWTTKISGSRFWFALRKLSISGLIWQFELSHIAVWNEYSQNSDSLLLYCTQFFEIFLNSIQELIITCNIMYFYRNSRWSCSSKCATSCSQSYQAKLGIKFLEKNQWRSLQLL